MRKDTITITLKSKKLMKDKRVIAWLKLVNKAVNEDIKKRIKEGGCAYPFSL